MLLYTIVRTREGHRVFRCQGRAGECVLVCWSRVCWCHPSTFNMLRATIALRHLVLRRNPFGTAVAHANWLPTVAVEASVLFVSASSLDVT